MAQIRLQIKETVASGLPPVCIVCGRPAVTHVRKTFLWRPGWTSWLLLSSLFLTLFTLMVLLPLFIVVVVVSLARTRHRAVETPLCALHRHYWGWRGFWLYFPLLVIVVAVLGECALMLNKLIEDEPFRWLFGGSIVMFVLWAIVAAVLHSSTIRASEISDTEITLHRVDRFFVESLRHDRGEARQRQRPEPAWPDYDPYPRSASAKK
jgi:hypothetical protein